MHAVREKEVLLLMIDPMEGLTSQILLGRGVDHKALGMDLIRVNQWLIHLAAKVEALMEHSKDHLLQDRVCQILCSKYLWVCL